MIRTQRGSTMLMMMFLVMLLAAATLQMMEWQSFQVGQVRRISSQIAVEQIRSKLTALILNTTAWNKTLQKSSLSNGLGALYSADGQLFFDSRNPSAGWGMDGRPCFNFDSANGNDQCPFRFEIRILSADAAAGKFIFKAKSLRLANQMTAYDFNIDRSQTEKNVRSSCLSIGGIFDDATGACQSKMIRSDSCPAGSLVRGVANSGSACLQPTAVTAGPCPAGQVVSEITNGQVNCVSHSSYAHR